MKVAVCLHGLSYGKSDLAKRGRERNLEGGFNVFIDGSILRLFSGHEVDFFSHTWGQESDSVISEHFRPKYKIHEEQIHFAEQGNYLHSIKSRWYSAYRSVGLLENYQKDTGCKYDYALLSRFDVRYFTDFDLDKLESEKFYCSNWVTEDPEKDGLLDYWFLSNPENMIIFSKLYEDLDNLVSLDPYPSSHWLAIRHLQKAGIRNSLMHVKSEKIDFELTRRVIGVRG